MKKILITLAATLGIMLSTSQVSADEGIASLRGTVDLNAEPPVAETHKQISQKGGFDRSYKQQPPMIPHSIEKETITLTQNTCMKCHSKETHEKEKAPMIGESHFKDRDGKVLDKVSSRRHFCNQCHAPQLDVSPLVKNDFAGAK